MTAKKTKFETKAKARVAIAKDVIKWMDTEKMRVAQFGYLSFSDALFDQEDVDNNTDLRSKLQGKECTVCALGAVFLTTVDRFNKVGCSDLLTESDTHTYLGDRIPEHSSLERDSLTKYLKSYFTLLQLCMIESAFECGEFSSDFYDNAKALKQIKQAEGYGNDLRSEGHNSKSRMRKIMNNVIRNKGTFKP